MASDWFVAERDEVWVERLGRFEWQVMSGRERGSAVSVYEGKPHWFRWAARRHARRYVSYSVRRTGLTRDEAYRAIGIEGSREQ